MGDLALKIESLEAIDRFIVGPVVKYFLERPAELGGVMIAPDHYTNCCVESRRRARAEAHSLHPVPFALWNGRDQDAVASFGEEAAQAGRYGNPPVGHLDLLRILGVTRTSASGPVVAPDRVLSP